MGPAARSILWPWMAVVPILAGACGQAGGWDGPGDLGSSMPGPFETIAPVEICMDMARVDGPGGPGAAPSGGGIGSCVAAMTQRIACSSDSQCESRQRCVCGHCRVPVCLSGADCPPGYDCMSVEKRCLQRCIGDADCPPDEICDLMVLGCTSRCDLDEDCQFGEVCSATRGVCVTALCSGSAGCTGSRECEPQRRTLTVSRPAPFESGSRALVLASVDGLGIMEFERVELLRWVARSDDPVVGAAWIDPTVAARPRPPGDPLAPVGFVMLAGRDDGSGIDAFESPDGSTWAPMEDAEGPAVVPEQEWEHGWVGRPSLSWDATGWIVAWEGGPGEGIGVARMSELWTVVRPEAPGPSITPGQVDASETWDEVDALMAPFLFHDGCDAVPRWDPYGTGSPPAVAMLFEGSGLEAMELAVGGAADPEINSSVGYARIGATGSVSPDPRNPLFASYAGIAVTRSESTPAVMCQEGTWVLLFQASDPSDGESTGIWAALSY